MRAIISGRASEQASEFARKVTLIYKATIERYFRQREIRVDQGSARHPQPQLTQVFLRSTMETAAELAFKGPDGHVCQASQLLIGNRFVVVIAYVR